MPADLPPTDATPPAPPLIDSRRLAALLGTLACRFDVDALAACDSTNAVLLARPQAASGSVVVADRQSAGRGRRGRTWLSEPGRSLTFSLLWRFERAPAAMAGLSLAVGTALTRALAGTPGIALKWPNDLLRRDRDGWGKVGGVLVELAADRQGCAAVIGIGINLLPPVAPVDAGLPALGLADDAGTMPDRHAILAAVLSALCAVLDRFGSEGFAPFADEWQRGNAFAGELVRVEENAVLQAEGLCLGVDADGALLLESGGQRQRWISGDVSLRPA